MAYDGTIKFDTSIDTNGFQKDANRIGDIFKGLGIFKIVEEGFRMITDSVDKAISRYDTLNRFPRVLEQMGFSADDASAATKKLSDGVQGLPTALDDVVSTAQRITVLTGNLEGATDTTLALNNAFLASGSTAEDASRGLTQYVQMLSSGKVDMMSWRTLQETMGVALQGVAESFGFAGESAQNYLYAALLDGNITFKEFNGKLVELDKGVGGFADRAKTATGGIGTAFANLKTRTAAGVTEIIAALDRGFSKTRFKSIEGIIDATGTAIKNILSGIAPVFAFVAEHIELFGTAVLVAVGALMAFKAVSIITGILDGIKTAMEYAAIAAEWFAVGEGAATIATTGLTAAQTIKAAVIGFVTGQIGLAEAAQWAWNAAMTANPIGVVVAAIAILVGAIVGLIALLGSASEEEQALKDETNALIDSTRELADQIEQTDQKMKDSNREIEASITLAGYLSDEIKALAEVEGKSAAQKEQMADMVNELNSAMPGLNLQYDKQRDLLSMTNAEIDKSIKLLGEQAEAEALKEIAIEKQREIIETQLRLKEIAEQRKKVEEQLAKVLWNTVKTNEYGNMLKDLAEEEENLIKKGEELGESREVLYGMLQGFYEKTADSSHTLTEAEEADAERRQAAWLELTESQVEQLERLGLEVDDYKALLEEFTESEIEQMQELGIEAEDYGKLRKKLTEEQIAQMEELGVGVEEYLEILKDEEQAEKRYLEEVAKARESYADVTQNAFKKIANAAKTTAAEMITTLEHNQKEFDAWGKNLETLMGRSLGNAGAKIHPLLLQKLKDMGPEGRGYVEALVNATDEELLRMNELMRSGSESATEVLKLVFGEDDFINSGSDAVDDIAKGIENNPAMSKATREVVKDTKEAVSAQVKASNFVGVGLDVANGLASGIRSGKYSVMSAASGLIAAAMTAARRAADSRSPARRFMPLGEDIDAGIAVGMEARKLTQAAASDLMQDAYKAAAMQQSAAARTSSITNIYNTAAAASAPVTKTNSTSYTYNSPKALGMREIRQQQILADQRQRLGVSYG